jgi:hypothetical protein
MDVCRTEVTAVAALRLNLFGDVLAHRLTGVDLSHINARKMPG